MTETVDTVTYRGCTIEIYLDQDADNPWCAWDFQPPIVVHHDRRTDTSHAPDLDEITDLIPRSAWRELVHMANIKSFDMLLCEARDAMDTRSAKEQNWEVFREHLIDLLDLDSSSVDYLENLEALCAMAGLETFSCTSRGYSQSDWADILLVATPKWIKETGLAPERVQAALKDAAELWSSWAWGEVYGYVIPELEDGLSSSVWGFYGRDFDASGLLPDARSSIDWHIRTVLEKRSKKIKEWIRNRVPHQYREFEPALLVRDSN